MYKTRLILADDHSVLRTGLKLLLNNEPDMLVVGEASDGEQVLRLLEKEAADVLILDLTMPVLGGLECLKEIRSRGIKIKTLILTMHEDDEYVVQAMQFGALGYVEKHAVDTELFEAVRSVAKGYLYLNSSRANLLIQGQGHGREQKFDDPYTLLSFREREVLKYLSRGYSMSRIAQLLNISVKTVDTYKTRMMEKLGFNEKSELVQYALRYGLLSSDNIPG
jgi:two-component system, NarL family, response regulator NreC